jgi:hypothetical protein
MEWQSRRSSFSAYLPSRLKTNGLRPDWGSAAKPGIKIAYDGLFCRNFLAVRPPDESGQSSSAGNSGPIN